MHPAQYPPGYILPGTVYRVVRHLATGGMGSVYDVEDTSVEKRYVLKTLHPNLISREDLAVRMRDEAKSLAKLQHPNIVDVVTAGVTADAQKMPFYVMERLVGQNLRVVLEKTSALQLTHAYRIAIDVLDALEHAHENNIVHRDVKPENIFLHRNSNGTTTTKLLDFGIVRLLDRKASHTHGKFIGTLRYASPEQITGKKIGPATDIYSLGVVLFEMLCGRGPFDDAGDAYAIGSAHATQPAPPVSQFVRTSAEVERLVASALAKEPEARPRDCFAFASELRRILREEEAAPKSATAVNLVSMAGPSTDLQQLETGSVSSGPTIQGMVPPSDAVPGHSTPQPTPPTTRPERGAAAVSPIAPTLAAAGLVSYSPNVQVNATPTPAIGAGAVPPGFGPAAQPSWPPTRPSAPPHVAGPHGAAPIDRRPIDRNAPTRESAPLGATQRLAQNDTQMVDDHAMYGAAPGIGGAFGAQAMVKDSDDAVRSALGEAVSLVVPPVGGTGSNPGEIVFPPMQSASGTGPLSGEARTRPPERGPFFLVGAAAVIAVLMVGGAFIMVRKPWQAARGASTAAVPSTAVTASTSTESSPPSPPSPSPLPLQASASAAPTPIATGPAGTDQVASSPAGSVATTAAAHPVVTSPTHTARSHAAPVAPPAHTSRGSGEAKPKTPAPTPTKDVPFDP